ncbi:MAG: glycoside hydrolase family 127 protein [Candidatus Hydrogenedentes bacterium]|nr:glycoside hydrolase family 127 protein [Candidatus Hydrogenedentota bacterium]
MSISASVLTSLAALGAAGPRPAVEPRGELAFRIEMTMDRLVRGQEPAYTDDFILADVVLDPGYPRRFAEYSGDVSGRYIGAMALSPMPGDPARLESVVRGALAQQRADGRFGDPDLSFASDALAMEQMALLWGNGRMLVGLLEYHATRPDPEVLAAARRLGDFLVRIQTACASADVQTRLEGQGASGFICFTQLIEGLVLLSRATGDASYAQAATAIYPWLQPRGTQHSHGYLTTLRGMIMLYEDTRDAACLRAAEDAYQALVASPDYQVYGGVAEYFGGKGDRDEGCSVADFLRLSLQLWRATGNVDYLDRAERCLMNHFSANQFSTGDFGHRVLAEHGLASTFGIGCAWWCCTMHGLRAFPDVLDAIYTVNGDHLHVNLFLDCACSGPVWAVSQQRTPLPGTGFRFTVTVEHAPAGQATLAIRRPAWAGRMALSVNGAAADVSDHEGYLVCRRAWQAGDTVAVDIECRVRLETRTGALMSLDELGDTPVEAVLWYGPWILGVNKSHCPLFFGEPWAGNVILLSGALRPADAPGAAPSPDGARLLVPEARFRTSYRHDGFPEPGTVVLEPISEWTACQEGAVAVWLKYRRGS